MIPPQQTLGASGLFLAPYGDGLVLVALGASAGSTSSTPPSTGARRGRRGRRSGRPAGAAISSAHAPGNGVKPAIVWTTGAGPQPGSREPSSHGSGSRSPSHPGPRGERAAAGRREVEAGVPRGQQRKLRSGATPAGAGSRVPPHAARAEERRPAGGTPRGRAPPTPISSSPRLERPRTSPTVRRRPWITPPSFLFPHRPLDPPRARPLPALRRDGGGPPGRALLRRLTGAVGSGLDPW